MWFIQFIFRSVVQIVALWGEQRIAGRSSPQPDKPQPAGSRAAYWQTRDSLFWFDE
jgi:hypothetical protein